MIWKLNIGALHEADETYRSLSRTSRAVFLFFAAVCVVSSVGLVYLLNASVLVATPARGGTLTEGLIGSPRFINPVLAISDADRDLTQLVYSGLLHATPAGEYVPDLAASYTVSPDGKTYTFVLRKGITFSDGTPVTADDVVFTVLKIQDAAVKSPVRANWDGVAAAALDTATVQFVLKSPYAPFIQNATLGILPKHLWSGVSAEEFPFSELNTSPVGSGPYRVAGISRSASGIASSYNLSPFGAYALGAPYLSLTLNFYQSETSLVQALTGGGVDAASGLSPESLAELKGEDIATAPLNRIFAAFFNQNQSEVLRDKDVRAALNAAVDRNDLVQKVLGGYGTALTGPVPPSVLGKESDAPISSSTQELAAAAKQMLIKKGWQETAGVLTKTTGTGKNAKTLTLAFDLATGDVPELRSAAQYLKTAWAAVGASVNVKIFEQGDLSQNVIRPRKFDALLFGEVVGRELDLFAFWHSSQRNDPGLNIAGYANSTADKDLQAMRTSQSDAERTTLYQQFVAELIKDIPAVFLYTPDFVYSIPKDIQGVDLGLIEQPSDRFLSITAWHREVNYVWPFLRNF